MRIILPVTRLRRHQPLHDVVACLLVCVPKGVGCVDKSLCHRFCRSVESFFCVHFDEGQVHVNIIEEAGEFVVEELYVVFGIFYLNVVGNGDAPIAELCRSAISTANRLSCPAAFYFVEQYIVAHRESAFAVD